MTHRKTITQMLFGGRARPEFVTSPCMAVLDTEPWHLNCTLYHLVQQTQCINLTSSDEMARAEAEITRALISLVEEQQSLEQVQFLGIRAHCQGEEGCIILRRTLVGLCCHRMVGDGPVIVPPRVLWQLGMLMKASLNGIKDVSHDAKNWVVCRDIIVLSFGLACDRDDWAHWLLDKRSDGNTEENESCEVLRSMVQSLDNFDVDDEEEDTSDTENTANEAGKPVVSCEESFTLATTRAARVTPLRLYFVHNILRDHEVWQRYSLWETIITESFGQKSKDQLPVSVVGEIILPTPVRDTRRGAVISDREKEIDSLICQLGFMGYAMCLSGVPKEKVQRFIRRIPGIVTKLGTDSIDAILESLFGDAN